MEESSDMEEAERVKKELKVKYKVKTIKKVNYILSIKIKKIEKGIRILQKAYAS